MQNKDWLAQLNDDLSGHDPEPGTDLPAHESVFVIGAPRSGTTLLSQFICAAFDVGYVDNLMACFWKAPVYGAMLSRKLLKHRVITSRSEFGATKLATDPHEFGGFWRSMLNYQDMTQQGECDSASLNDLAVKLDQISKVFALPMIYKVFQLTWHMVEYQKLRPQTRWVWVHRDVERNALSLLKFREHLHGDRSKWASSRPLSADLITFANPFQEVVYQVLAINAWIRKQLAQIDPHLFCEVEFESFTTQPLKSLNTLEKVCGPPSIESGHEILDGIVAGPSGEYRADDVSGVQAAIRHFALDSDLHAPPI